MSAIRDVIKAFYTVVDSMTTANSFNNTWVQEKSREKLFTKGGKLGNRISIYMPSGENLDGTDLNGGAQGEFNFRHNLEIHARVPLNSADVKANEVSYETNLDVMDGLWDIVNAYEMNSEYANTICATAAYNWEFVDYETEIMEREDKFNGVKLVCKYIVDLRAPMEHRL